MEEDVASLKEELALWKRRAEEHKQNYEDAQVELEEYQVSSRELEAELEAQLEQAETKVRELTSANQRLQMDNESAHEKLQDLQAETHRQINSLADDLGAVTKSKDELLSYIRELEHANDSLENSKRQTISTLEDFEARLNQALERNAYLENELEEKDQLHATIQRLKDESRDLRLEMSLKTRSPSGGSVAGAAGHTSRGESFRDDDAAAVAAGSAASPRSSLLLNGNHDPLRRRSTPSPIPPTTPRSPGAIHGTAFPAGDGLTPTARITALNIVGDLLRKVGSLESKLASCRSTTTMTPTSPMIVDGPRPRPNTVAEFGQTPASAPSVSRPRANAISAPVPMATTFENYV